MKVRIQELVCQLERRCRGCNDWPEEDQWEPSQHLPQLITTLYEREYKYEFEFEWHLLEEHFHKYLIHLILVFLKLILIFAFNSITSIDRIIFNWRLLKLSVPSDHKQTYRQTINWLFRTCNELSLSSGKF